MDNNANLGISSVILLISFMLIAITALSVISDTSTENMTTEEEIDQMLDEALDPITKNVQIIDRIGKYYGEPRNQKIQKIGIMIKPMLSEEIDLTELSIKISNGDSIRILYNSNHAQKIGSNNLFEHPIWQNLTQNNYGLIVTFDKDNSLVDYHTLNKNTDQVYIVFRLSPDFYMKKGDTIIVQLFPSSGLKKTTILEAPLPMKSIVSL